VLGFILGKVIERYLFISIQRYGIDWMWRPIVIAMFALAIGGLLRSFLRDVRGHGGFAGMMAGFGTGRFAPGNLLPAALIILIGSMLAASRDWGVEAKIIPLIVGGGAALLCALSLANDVFGESSEGAVPRRAPRRAGEQSQERASADASGAADAMQDLALEQKIHMDIASHIAHLPTRTKLTRGAVFFAWMGAFLGSMALIGLIATVPLFIIAYMRLEGGERWSLTLPMATATTLFIYGLFDRLLAIPWPQTLLGTAVPMLKAIPGV
jgi:hypothetical protein